ncbi:MAG: hypothetical protein ACYDA9_04775 [Terriglobia bacterium]
MKKLIAAAVLLLMAPIMASAQGKLDGYAFLAPSVGGGQNAVDTGVGGEVFFLKRFGAEAEVSYYAPDWTFCTNCDYSGMGVGSLDLIYRLPVTGSRIEPFAAGGYSGYTIAGGASPGYASGYNIGGGVNVWFKRRVALRLDVRYQGNAGNIVHPVSHFVAFRIGVTFR